MRKFLLILFMVFLSVSPSFASKIPENIQQLVEKTFPNTTFRFDGVIVLPDATVYLPLFPAKPLDVEEVKVQSTIPAGKTLAQKPEIVILNNDYVLMKVISSKDGHKTLLAPSTLPNQITSGLLPQDMLVPKGLVIPENLKGIIGNLNLETAENPNLKVDVLQSKSGNKVNSIIPELKNKTFYVATGYSKNIQVINSENKSPAYALAQTHVPNDMKGYDNKFLLVTSFGSSAMNVISLADEDIIKQIHFNSQPDEILIDGNIAYVSSSEDASIYIVNLDTMTLSKQIKINGMCEKLTLNDNKIFYFDKKTNEIWAVELDNNYLLKDIGKFPNVSKIAYANGKIYITSRTKNRLAIVDYEKNELVKEIPICEKPVDMIVNGDNLFILGAVDNVIQVIDTTCDEMTDTIYLGTKGFSTNLDRIDNTNLAIVSDSRASVYCVLDMSTKRIVKNSAIEVPIRTIVVTDRVKKIND